MYPQGLSPQATYTPVGCNITLFTLCTPVCGQGAGLQGAALPQGGAQAQATFTPVDCNITPFTLTMQGLPFIMGDGYYAFIDCTAAPAEFLIAARGRASNALAEHGGRSETGGVRERQLVPVVALDDLLSVARPPALIKIDVEGMEIEVVRGALETLRTHRPALFIETHGVTRETATTFQLLRELGALGYRAIHAETGNPITPETVPTSGSVHLYCSWPK